MTDDVLTYWTVRVNLLDYLRPFKKKTIISNEQKMTSNLSFNYKKDYT